MKKGFVFRLETIDMTLKFFLFAVFFIHMVTIDVMADDVVKKSKELTALQKRIKLISLQISELKTKKKSLDSELRKLEIDYGKSAVLLTQLEFQVEQQRNVLKKNQQQIGVKLQQIDFQKHVLARQVKLAYGMGKNEKLKLMLNQQDPVLSGRMIVYFDYLNQSRLKEILKIDEDIQQLRILESQKRKETTNLEKKLTKIRFERSNLLKTKRERKVLLTKLNGRFDSKKQQLSRFKISEKKLKSLILSLQQTMEDFPFEEGTVKAFSKLKGNLSWPIKGRLVKKFGDQRSDSRWDGVLIKAKEGENIRVVTRGRVVYADWLRGYGLLTIIDHGEGYMTLYAFNQSLYKTVGDWVEAGAVIATVGQSGGQAETGLYFGIRKKGKPVDPVKWCRKVRRGKVG